MSRGRPPEVDDDELTEAVERAVERTGFPAVRGADVAEQLPIKERAVRNRLNELADAGEVRSRKFGTATAYAPLTAPQASFDGVEAGGPAADPVGSDDVQEQLVEDAIQEIEPPGGRDPEAAREAVRAAYCYLRDHGPAPSSEILEEIYPGHPAGYQTGTRHGGWWRHLVKPGLEQLPTVSKPVGGQAWRVVDE